MPGASSLSLEIGALQAPHLGDKLPIRHELLPRLLVGGVLLSQLIERAVLLGHLDLRAADLLELGVKLCLPFLASLDLLGLLLRIFGRLLRRLTSSPQLGRALVKLLVAR